MNPVFLLGIQSLWQELREMSVGGIWWVNTDSQDDQIALINQTLASQTATCRAGVLISDESICHALSFDTGGPERVRLFTFKPMKESLLSLRNDLLCSVIPDQYLFILPTADSLWQAFNADELRAWLHAMNRWAEHQNCSFLIISNGPHNERLTSLLINQYRGLNGLAALSNLGGDYRLDVEFWCNERGVSAQQHIELEYFQGQWTQSSTANSAPQPINDSRLILSHKVVLEGAPPLSEYWSLFEDNESLYSMARTAQAATVIFSLTQNSQIERLATMVHALRRQRGSALKLVIREQSANLRATDERLLLGCGASLIVPGSSSLSRCLSLIESIQGQVFNRQIPEDIQVLIKAMHPLELRGYQNWNTFCQALDIVLNNPLMPEDARGVLVALRPVPGLRVEQALTLCRPNRMGDIMTLGDNRLYLFLTFCRINDLDIALKHIFPLPIGDLISNRLVWYEDKQLAAELSQMRLTDPALRSQPLSSDAWQPPSMNASHDGRAWRRQPERIVLLDHASKEATP